MVNPTPEGVFLFKLHCIISQLIVYYIGFHWFLFFVCVCTYFYFVSSKRAKTFEEKISILPAGPVAFGCQ